MAEQISDNEIVGLFRELQAIDVQIVDAEAKVNAAYDEWIRVTHQYQSLAASRQPLAFGLTKKAEAISKFGPNQAYETKAPLKAQELTPREHEVWLTAYSATHAAHAPHGIIQSGPSRSQVAASATSCSSRA